LTKEYWISTLFVANYKSKYFYWWENWISKT
jgi:hypothetical protein